MDTPELDFPVSMILLAGSALVTRLVMLIVFCVLCAADEKVVVRISVGKTSAPVVGSVNRMLLFVE
jgi:hypothetical protein